MNSLVKLRALVFSLLVFELYLNVVVIFILTRLSAQYRGYLTTIYELLLTQMFHNSLFQSSRLYLGADARFKFKPFFSHNILFFLSTSIKNLFTVLKVHEVR